MINALQSALSGIRLGTTMLDVAAHNVANLYTEGYERKGVVGREIPGGGVEPRITTEADDGIAADLVAAIIARHTVSANASLFRRADAMTGDLVNILG